MVAVSKKYVKKGDLMSAIDEMLKTYRNLRVEYPCDVEEHFLVKAWSKRKQ